jgi:replicative DNA helicase
MAIRPLGEVALQSFKDLKKYQLGKSKPIKTGREWLDDIFGGLLPGDIATIAGASGGGKSFEVQRIKNFVMDLNNNDAAADYVWLDYAWEMRFMSNILRDLNRTLGKTKKDILTVEFTEEEKALVKSYSDNLSDGRYFINEDTITPKQFEKECSEFLELQKDKKAVFISIDHIALGKDETGEKKNTVDSIIEIINRLKKEYPNSYWIVLSQMNRNILGRIKDKDIMAMPNRSDIFQSDAMFFISDYLYICHNPYRLGIKQFSRVNEEAYDYLKDHFCEEKNGKVSFDTLGKMFYIVLKSRESDVIFRDIFIEDVGVKDKEKYRDKPEQAVMSYDIPMFAKKPDLPEIEILPPPPLGTLADAFGPAVTDSSDDDDDGAPF